MPLEGFTPYRKADAAKYNRRRWWLGITFGDMLDRAADIYPDREALVDDTMRLTYAQLKEKTDRLAIGLMGLGIKPRDRILVQLPNWGEFVYTYFAIQKIGAIIVVLLARHAQIEVNHLCRLTGASAWIVPEKYHSIDYLPIIEDGLKANPSLKEVILARSRGAGRFLSLEKLIDSAELSRANLQKLAKRRPSPMEVAHMGPTGGSTGLPKVAARTHNDYICNVEYIARAMEMCCHDTCMVVTPIGHNLAVRVALLPAIFTFGKVVMQDSREPADILSTIQNEKVTVLAWVPPLASSAVYFEGLKQYDTSSLQRMYVSTQASPPQLIKDLNEKFKAKVVVAYAGTEGFHFMTRMDYDQSQIHKYYGRVTCPYDQYKVVDENGKELPPGTPGELIVKGPGVFTGYYNAPEENAHAFTLDGFFKTGDKVAFDSAGNVMLTGRIKDIIKRAGENISPIEIESLISTHPDVAMVSVVGMPDAVVGERACAYLQLKSGVKPPTLQDINGYLKSKGASVLQMPERIEFMSSMPLTKAGKADKNALRDDIRKKLIAEGKLPA